MKIDIQNISCGVPRAIWEPASIPARWNDPQSEDPQDHVYRYLSDKIVALDSGGYRVLRPEGGYKKISSKMTAVSTCAQMWRGAGRVLVTKKEVHDFVGSDKAPGEIWSVDKVVTLPVDVRLVKMEGDEVALNDWVDLTIEPSDHWNEDVIDAILKWINESLCAGEPAPRERLWEQLTEPNEPNEFRYLLHWLARVRQQLGRYGQTAIWLHGPATHIGKNLLGELMRRCLGARYTVTIREADVERGWTNATFGKLFAVCDEWKTSTIDRHEEYLKQLIGNPRNEVVARRLGQIDSLNLAHVLILMNNAERVRWLTPEDRRITLIHTSEQLEHARALASEVGRMLKGRHPVFTPRQLIENFNLILCSIPIDEEMLEYPLQNERRASMIQQNRHVLDVWLEEDELLVREKWIRAADAFLRFQDWHLEKQRKPTGYSPIGFGRDLVARTAWVEAKRSNGSSQYLIKASPYIEMPAAKGKVVDLLDEKRRQLRAAAARF